VIGVAQEFARVFQSSKKQTSSGGPWFSFFKQDRRVTCYYFYVWDAEFGPGFIKICTYFPYPMKIWVNGHEWAKRQADKHGLAYRVLANGFASCEDPTMLQQICDSLTPDDIQQFATRWLNRVPVPLDHHDHEAGYWWEWSMRQIEVSRTISFTQPRYARLFVDQLVTDNLTMGRPEELEVIFAHKIRGGMYQPTKTDTKTRVVREGARLSRPSPCPLYLAIGSRWSC
jgi:hypothetical protein